MTIQSALERAKKLQQERKAAEQTHKPVPKSGVSGGASTGTVPLQETQPVPISRAPVAPKRIQLPIIPYDLTSSIEHRLLVDEALTDKLAATAVTAYRMVRTRVLHRFRGTDWTTFGLTSPGPGEGKTVTAINLAMTLAREKSREVFLIDLDMKSPSICDYLGVQPPADLVQYFMHGSSLDRMFFSIGIEYLAIAGCASASSHSSEMLSGQRLEGLLAYIRSIANNPIIILDLPPVLSADDALVVAPRIDATFLVVGVGQTKRDTLTRAIDILREHSMPGIIVNRTDQVIEDYYSG
jgi:protein-tyrosine kinase